MSEPRRRFSVHSRLRSFGFAFSGLRHFAIREHNAWIHAAATLVAIALAALFHIERTEWSCLILAIGWVWMAEAFNTAIERLADAVTGERRADIKIVKDLAAAGVLISAIGAALIGALIFWPYLAALRS